MNKGKISQPSVEICCTFLAKIYFIIGEDSVAGLPQWKDWDELQRLAAFVSYPRTPESSTEIRRRIARGESLGDLVPECVGAELKRLFAKKERR